MKFIETKLSGAYIIQLEPIQDERGFFARGWCQKEFQKMGLNGNLVQCNLSYNHTKGTLRGLHYQQAPHAEVKLIRCINGSIYDVIVDLRPESSTYKQWFGIELSSKNRTILYVPEGFAHGFQTLENDSEVFYQVSEFYTPGAEKGLRWNDPQFNIQWPEISHRIISSKDQNHADFTE